MPRIGGTLARRPRTRRTITVLLTVVAMAACGSRVERRSATPPNRPAPTTTRATQPPPTTTTTSTSVTTTEPTGLRSRDGIEPGQLAAITSCEPVLAGHRLGAVSRSGTLALAVVLDGDLGQGRLLHLEGGRWHDSPDPGQDCAPTPDKAWIGTGGAEFMVSAFQSRPVAWVPVSASMYGPARNPSFVYVVGLIDRQVIPAAVGGGVFVVLSTTSTHFGVACAYDDTGKLRATGDFVATPPAGVQPIISQPTVCPSTAPPPTR